MRFMRMAVYSNIVLLFLVLTPSETLSRDCEEDSGSSIIEMSKCLTCTGCYNLVELNYNVTLEAHANLTSYYEYFLNISQLDVSQLLDHYKMMLVSSNNLAMETSKNEKNLTLQLSVIANATIQASQRLDMLNRNLSVATNSNLIAVTTHSNSEVILGEITTLVNTISDLVSGNITDLSRLAERYYDNILKTLDLLTDVAKNASSMSRQQEELVVVINSTTEEAHKISAMALATLCRAIDVHNTTSNLIRQLSSQDAVNVKALQQQINVLVTQIQLDIYERDVFNTSQRLINQVENVTAGIPLYDVELLQSIVHDVVHNITELVTNFNSSFDHFSDLEEQAAVLNDTGEALLQTGRELKDEADVLFMMLNETFTSTMQTIDTAHSYFDNVTVLHLNLTAVFHSFNESITDVVRRLEEAENVTEVASNSSIDGQEDLRHIRQLLSTTAQSLNKSTSQLADDNATLTIAKNRTEGDKRDIDSQKVRAELVMTQTKEKLDDVSKLNETSIDQSVQLNNSSLKVKEVEERLEMINTDIRIARNNLTSLMESLKDLDITNITIAEMKVRMANYTVEQNNRSLNNVKDKMEVLEASSNELQDKYTQLKQHRDLLQKILDNVGENPCGRQPSSG